MKVLVLAAGYGTRLKSISQNKPKPLLEINGRPILDYILDRIRSIAGLDEVIIVTNDKFVDDFQSWVKEQKYFPCDIHIVNDGTKSAEERLGSIGDIDYVLRKQAIDDDLLVIGADNLFDYDIDQYIKFARNKPQCVSIGLYDVGDLKHAQLFGIVEIDQNGKLISFEEKPQQPQSTLAAMCFYYLPKATLNLVGQYLEKSAELDKAGDYIKWLNERNDVFGFKFTGKWYDIGSPESYREAQQAFR